MKKKIVVFCGSSENAPQEHKDMAFKVGENLSNKSYDLVYGGASIGIMGKVANGHLNKGCKTIGVIPHFLMKKEVMHNNLNELIETKTMHERKEIMFNKSSVCLVLPGGIGTLDELFECFTWNQLGLHHIPIIIYNYQDHFKYLLLHLKNMVEENYLEKKCLDSLNIVQNESELYSCLSKIEME